MVEREREMQRKMEEVPPSLAGDAIFGLAKRTSTSRKMDHSNPKWM